jgi:hypothetical protein
MSNMFLNIVSVFKGEGVREASGAISKFQTGLKPFSSLLGKAAAGLAAFGVTAKTIEFTRNSIESARDLERNLFGIDKVFGTLGPQMQQFSKDAAEMGLSQSKAAKATTFIGSVLKQSGFEMADVAVETQKLISLAQDLSTLYGYDVQEALLGMTALFRGEYDPIEKFGVAMKQSEINSELAARGLNNLEGAARRNAEQTIRLELLYQRSADAVGTFAEQSGTLYVEQKKLGATFENFQASLGAAVIPAVAELNTLFTELLEDITPGLQSAFEFLAQILSGVVGLISDALDPNTALGESVAALGIQFESLFKTIFGPDVTIADFFDAAGFAIGAVLDGLHDLLMVIENIIIFFQVMGEAMYLFFTDMDAFFAFDQGEELKKRIDLRDRLNGNSLAVKQYIAEWDKARDLKLSGHITGINRTADAWERANRAASLYSRPKGLPGSADAIERWLNVVAPKTEAISTDIASITSATTGSTAAPAAPTGPTGIQAWLEKAQLEAQIAAKRMELMARGLSEAAADSILSATDPIKSANEAIAMIWATGTEGLTQLRNAFNQSAEGQRLAAQEAAEAAEAAIKLSEYTSEQAKKAAEEAAEAAEVLRQQEQEILDKRQKAMESFADSVKGIFGGIKDSIMSAFSLPDLGNSVNSITRNIKKLLERTKDFAKNITSLSDQGLGNELLQQIIAAGPVAGGRLAQALASAGGGTIGELNQAFGEFGGIASDIAGVGTRSQFANAQVVNTYNIEVNGGVGTGATIGKAIVEAIKSYERTSGAVWQGAA